MDLIYVCPLAIETPLRVTHSVAARSLWSGVAEEAEVVAVLSSVMAVPIPLTTMPVSPSKSNLT